VRAVLSNQKKSTPERGKCPSCDARTDETDSSGGFLSSEIAIIARRVGARKEDTREDYPRLA